MRRALGRTEYGAGDDRVKSDNNFEMSNGTAQPAWAQVWHLWTVFIPRRSITGRLVFGRVWRRYDGRHWIYKRVVEYANDG
jgi:hypothetical protein